MNIEELKNKKWYIQSCNATPIMLMSAAESAREMQEKLGFGYTEFLYEMEMDFGKMCYRVDDLERLGKIIYSKLDHDPKYFKKIRALHRRDQKISGKLFKEIDSTDLGVYTDRELILLIKRAVQAVGTAVGVGHLIEPYALTIDAVLKEELSHFVRDAKDLNQKFITLTTPTDISFVQEAEEALGRIKAAKGASREKYIRDYISGFEWSQNSYAGRAHIDRAMIEKMLLEFKPGAKRDMRTLKREKKKIIKEYNLPKQLVARLETLEFLTSWQDERKKYILIAVGYEDLLLAELARRMSIPIEHLRYLRVEELDSDIKSLAGELEKRRTGSIYVQRFEKPGSEVATGEEFLKIKKTLESSESLLVKELSGNAASVGKVIGRVKVCTTIASLAKVEDGDVLVASMTRPEYMLAMKKAAAFVTDEGCITCHAAIVAREMHKPCVIGTKNATKVLKDGDLVEVKGSHGLVIILEHA